MWDFIIYVNLAINTKVITVLLLCLSGRALRPRRQLLDRSVSGCHSNTLRHRNREKQMK